MPLAQPFSYQDVSNDPLSDTDNFIRTVNIPREIMGEEP